MALYNGKLRNVTRTYMGNKQAVGYDHAFTVDDITLRHSGAVVESAFAMTLCHLPFWTIILN